MKPIQNYFTILVGLILFTSCTGDENPSPSGPDTASPDATEQLSIFFFNDQHGQIDNFAKIKPIVEEAATRGNTLLVCAGDAFTGNPIVDQFSDKGYPMIDLMNQVGVDVAAIGNHEFDYGQTVLADRLDQSQFPWICANVDMGNTDIPEPLDFVSMTAGNLKVTFLSFVETNGKDNAIPSTHPWRVEGISFSDYSTRLAGFQDLKTREDSDLLIVLTHLGHTTDLDLATNFNFFDAIIGGHSHRIIDEVVNGKPVVQAGDDLELLGRLDLSISDGEIVESEVTFIDLSSSDLTKDATIQAAIDEYDSSPEFTEIVGIASSSHDIPEIGCFFTHALKELMEVDFAIQNSGGIRSEINQGPITRLEIFEMDPFNNGSVVFTKTVGDYKDFFCTDGGWYTIAGVEIEEGPGSVRMFMDGVELADAELLSIGMNDFIPANNPEFFPFEEAEIKNLTTAETIIQYLTEVNNTVDFENCNNFFQCD